MNWTGSEVKNCILSGGTFNYCRVNHILRKNNIPVATTRIRFIPIPPTPQKTFATNMAKPAEQAQGIQQDTFTADTTMPAKTPIAVADRAAEHLPEPLGEAWMEASPGSTSRAESTGPTSQSWYPIDDKEEKELQKAG